LDSNNRYVEGLEKLVIPSNCFVDFRAKLDAFGINASTVFPGLDGLSKYLEWKHIKYWYH
jgi:hypothetical protein